jgi:hypothetical protein
VPLAKKEAESGHPHDRFLQYRDTNLAANNSIFDLGILVAREIALPV